MTTQSEALALAEDLHANLRQQTGLADQLVAAIATIPSDADLTRRVQEAEAAHAAISTIHAATLDELTAAATSSG